MKYFVGSEFIDQIDSFITHRRQKSDLEKAQKTGIDAYNFEQKEKIKKVPCSAWHDRRDLSDAEENVKFPILERKEQRGSIFHWQAAIKMAAYFSYFDGILAES